MTTANSPLVTVVILTYNSAAYVVETLESIKEQTYQNLELIITDDCSADGTIAICEGWLESNKHRFKRAELITVEKNTGIPANCNRGLNSSRGTWIKYLAGDDALFNNAISSAVEFINNNRDVVAFASSVACFRENFKSESLMYVRNDSNIQFYNLSADGQYSLLLRNNLIHGASLFLKKEIILQCDKFVEKYNFLEDLPMWLKLTKAGNKIFYMNIITVKYRLHEKSVSFSESESKLFSNFYLKKRQFQKEMVLPNLTRTERIWKNYDYYLNIIFDGLRLNNNNAICKGAYVLLKQTLPLAIRKIYKGGNNESNKSLK